MLNPRFQARADKGQMRGKFLNKGRQIKGKILKNEGQIIAVACPIHELSKLARGVQYCIVRY